MAMTVPTQAIWTRVATDLTGDTDLSHGALLRVLDLAGQVKRTPSRFAEALKGQYLALLFEKPSLRTRMTFELAIKQLGGDAVLSVGPIGDREPLKDVARNLERWVGAIVARTFYQQTVDELAKWSSVPVINALSDRFHPCQALADVMTVQEHFGEWSGLKIAFVGDGNNVAHSLLLTATRLGMEVTVATPKGYEPDPEVVSQARKFAEEFGGGVTITHNAIKAVHGAHAVYTDVWTSMGQEDEADERKQIFQPYQVNDKLMSEARPDAIFLHCLPAKRGQEVTDSVIESQQSVVFDQAENRLHTQKALLLAMLS